MHVAPYDPEGLHIRFPTAISRDVLEEVASVVVSAHVNAPVIGFDLWGEVGKDRCGLLRWIEIDAALLGLNGKLPGVSVGRFNNDGGGSTHIELQAGEFVILVAHDADPNTVIPKSEYGKNLVRIHTPTLFSHLEPVVESIPQPAKRIACLFHSKSETKGERPDCIQVRFSDGADGYLATHMDLYAMFPRLMDGAWLHEMALKRQAARVAEETIKEDAMPQLKPAAQAGNQ
jgi:hypothetical protein